MIRLTLLKILVLMVFTVSLPVKAGKIDITQALLAQPEVVQGISSICHDICKGNNRKSWLTWAELDILPGTYSILNAHIRLRNRHIWKIFGKKRTAYSDHSTLKIKAHINNETCKASVHHKDIHFTNDLYKIGWWLARRLDNIFDFLPRIKRQLPICN
ncbi:secreted protein [Candidatus Thiomargarita nelsonii]|uniref:Secreted protein n=1 Tax=Candidatus Thiomargarita nelsonii TaxID=1003181 RepID=A0A176S4Q8_9GAMM|nr:secreted protein [Candidatus Thiomargarita nelsonii]